MRSRKLLALVAGAALTVGLSGAASATAAGPHSGRADRTTSASQASSGTKCVYTRKAPADRFKGLPKFNPREAAKPYTARLHTTQGYIAFRALTHRAPCTTNSFRFLAQRHYFDGTHCHRLTTRGIFVLQCGDPTGTGSGGPGYVFPDENLSGATYPAGTVAMANAGPNTNGSQFFFVYKDSKLAPAYTPFGKVTWGLNVLRRIARAGEDDQNGPGDGYPRLYVGFKDVDVSRR